MNLRLEKAEDCTQFKVFETEDVVAWVAAGNPST